MRTVVVDTLLTRGKTERMIAFVTADILVVLTKRVAQ
jgi:hypothetical protein